MARRSRVVWLVVFGASIVVGAFAGSISQPYWWLGLGPSIFVLIFAYLFLALRERSKNLRAWQASNAQRWHAGKEQRYRDEILEIPPNGTKQYSIRMSKRKWIRGDRVKVQTESDKPITVEIVDGEDLDAMEPGRSMPRAYSSNSKRVVLEFEAERDGTWLVNIINRNETAVSARVVIHYFAVRD